MAQTIDYDEIRKLVALLEEKNLVQFELEVEGLKIKIGRAGSAPAAPAYAAPAPAAHATGEPGASASAAAARETASGAHVVASPMVGTFYRAPDPTAAPFVEIGDVVRKGQTLCIIEAMKLMNEIESDVDGVVQEIFVQNAKPVEFGQKLFAIQPQA